MKNLFKIVVLTVIAIWCYSYVTENIHTIQKSANNAIAWLNKARERLEPNKYNTQPKAHNNNSSLGTQAYNRLSSKFKKNHSTTPVVNEENSEELEGSMAEKLVSEGRDEQEEVSINQLEPALNHITTTASISNSSSTQTVSKEFFADDETSDVAILPNESDPIKWVKGASGELSPSSWNMIMQYDKLPANNETKTTNNTFYSSSKPAETFHYLQGRNRESLLVSMATNVHEIAHGYFSYGLHDYYLKSGKVRDVNNTELLLYLNNYESIFISVPKQMLFPSHDLAKVIPKDLISFRYDTYIEGVSSTQNDGIVGLLDEFCAYYLGSKYAYDMLNAYKCTNDNSAFGFYNWVLNTQSSMTAYYEFDFFIKEYLLYMKNNSPEDYRVLKQSIGFKEGYSKVKSAYKRLIGDYELLINKQIAFYNNSGKAYCYIEDGTLYVGKGKVGSFVGSNIFSSDKQLLMPTLNSNRYDSLADF